MTSSFFQEIRHAVRLLGRSPGFTAVATLSLAIGIAANAALFSLHDALFFRPLPVPDPGAVVTVTTDRSDDPSPVGRVSYPNYRDLRDARAFEGLAAHQMTIVGFAPSRREVRQRRLGALVSDNFFQVLGIEPVLGRRFSPQENEVRGRDAVVMLGYDFWQNAFAGDRSVIGRAIVLNGVDFTVIGVTPEPFTGIDGFVRPEFYAPLMMAERLTASGGKLFEDRQGRSVIVKGRLKSGSTMAEAQAELTTRWAALAGQFPEENRDTAIAVRSEMQERARNQRGNAVTVSLMTTLGALVLVIACANVANLMLGRARARAREMAVRLALGVSRLRLLRQLLTESVLLALLGATLGLVFASGAIRFLAATIPTLVQSELPVVIAPALDSRALLFSVVATLASVLFFGVVPAWQSVRTELVPALKSAEPGATRRSRTFGRSALVVAQVALSMVLLVAAGILVDAFRRSVNLNPGFRTDRLLTMSLNTSLVGDSKTRNRDFYRDLVEQARNLPAVANVALTSALPLDQDDAPGRLAIVPEGYQPPRGQASVSVRAAAITEDYFETMGVALVRGRAFSRADSDATSQVAIVSEAFSDTYWPGQDPIGRRIQLADSPSGSLEVVGVAANARYSNIREAPTPFFYRPFVQDPRSEMTIVVQSREGAAAAALAELLREAVRAIDENQPVFNVRTFAVFYERVAVGPQLLLMRAVGSLGLFGLALSLTGLYALVAYSVARRTREIGVRMAMGADRANVLRLVLRQGLVLSVFGIAVGALGSVAVVRGLSVALAGLGAPNTTTYIVVPIGLLLLTLAASYVPARRASTLDPLKALRYE
jgi:macrolide transport system ATP-binding/permease protein